MATQSIQLKPRSANLFSTGQPALYLENGTNIPYSGYGFDASTAEQIFFDFKVPFYLSGNLTVTVRGYSQTGQTTGAVVMGAQIAALSAGDAQSVLTDALATANTATATINGTARGPTEVVITVTNLDSIAADDTVQLRLYRDATAGGDTLTGDFIVFDVEVEYAATGGVGSGNVNNAGSSTDNAIARFDLATGQVIQNSSASVDDSGNVSGTRFQGSISYSAILTATQANSTVTLADVTSFVVALPLGTYQFKVKGLWQSAATTTGLKLSARMATGAGGTYTGACAITTGAAGATESASQTAFNTVMGGVTGPGAVSVPFDYWGRFTVTTAGNFAIQFASEVAASAVTLQVGTMLEIIQT